MSLIGWGIRIHNSNGAYRDPSDLRFLTGMKPQRKQLFVDRLNREYDEKRTKLEAEIGNDEDVAGPQEAKVKHMRLGRARPSHLQCISSSIPH